MPVEELPKRVAVFWLNTTNKSKGNYAVVLPETGIIDPLKWGYCNILDAKNYGLPDAQVNLESAQNNMQPSKSVFAWLRTA